MRQQSATVPGLDEIAKMVKEVRVANNEFIFRQKKSFESLYNLNIEINKVVPVDLSLRMPLSSVNYECLNYEL
jgi:hypothetical protein